MESLISNITSSPWRQFRAETISTTVFADPETRLYYFKDSTLYFGNTAKNTLDSIQLHINDFAISDEVVYTPFKNASTITFTINENWIYIIGGVVVLTTIGLSIFQRRKGNRNHIQGELKMEMD